MVISLGIGFNNIFNISIIKAFFGKPIFGSTIIKINLIRESLKNLTIIVRDSQLYQNRIEPQYNKTKIDTFGQQRLRLAGTHLILLSLQRILSLSLPTESIIRLAKCLD